jgi:signal transduction histidine kinase
VLRNIFENAVRHGKAKNVTLTVIASLDQVRIEITNDGEKIPIDAQLLGKELLRDANSKSSGIGLFISKALVEKMQGKMLFEQDLGKLKQILVLKKV